MAFNTYGYSDGQWFQMTEALNDGKPNWEMKSRFEGAPVLSGFSNMITGSNLDGIKIVADPGVSIDNLFRHTKQLDYFNGAPHDFTEAVRALNMFKDSTVEVITNLYLPNAYDINFADTPNLKLLENVELSENAALAGAVFANTNPNLRIRHFNFNGCTGTQQMFQGSPNITLFEDSFVGMSSVTDAYGMFHRSGIRELKEGDIDTSGVKRFDAFMLIPNPYYVDGKPARVIHDGAINMSSAESCWLMFDGASLGYLGLKMENDPDVEEMFGEGNPGTELHIDVEGMTDLSYMFKEARHWEIHPGYIYNAHNIQNITGMFQGRWNAEIPPTPPEGNDPGDPGTPAYGVGEIKIINLIELHNVNNVTNLLQWAAPTQLTLEGLGAAEQPDEYKRTLDLTELSQGATFSKDELARSLAETNTNTPWIIRTTDNRWDYSIATNKGWIVDYVEPMPELEDDIGEL